MLCYQEELFAYCMQTEETKGIRRPQVAPTILPNIFLAFLNFAVPIMAKNNNCLQLFGALNCYNSERTFQRGGEMMTEEKFIHAVKRNSQRLFVIAFSYLKNKHDAEDALQNAFLKLWKSKIEFNDDLGIDKWLTKVLVNDCKNFFNLSFRQNKKGKIHFRPFLYAAWQN